MKEINIAEQPWLSLKRTVKITIDGIRYRLFRATVTVAVIVAVVAVSSRTTAATSAYSNVVHILSK